MTKLVKDAIHTRALLVSLHISAWSARKYDKAISNKVNADFAATSDAGRYNKMLLPGDTKSYKLLTTLIGQIRTEHYTKTLAWSDEGARLLPTAQYMNYTAWYRERMDDFRTARELFRMEYPSLREAAKQRLNGMYREADYPAASEITERFDLSIHFSPLPNTDDIRVSLPADQIAAIELSINADVDRSVQYAVKDAWQRLYTVVDKIRGRLSEPEAIFRDSLIANAIEMCDELSRLNVTNDQDLETMRQRVLRELTADTADTLRKDPAVRVATADRADQIIADMSALYGVAPAEV